jgi:hypothetical protein
MDTAGVHALIKMAMRVMMTKVCFIVIISSPYPIPGNFHCLKNQQL